MTTISATTLNYKGDELALFAHAVNWKNYFADHLRPYLGAEVLEVGAGLGSTTLILCAEHSRWVCLEPDIGMADNLARMIAAGQLPSCCLVEVGTIADLVGRVGEERFDSVVYIDVLEHIKEDRAELAEAIRLLRPGGHLVVLSPAFPWLYTSFDRAIGHFRRYRRAGLLDIAPVGARPVLARYLDSIGLCASLANRLLLRSRMPSQQQILTWDRLMVPLSRLVDPLVSYSFGRSILAVWQRVAVR